MPCETRFANSDFSEAYSGGERWSGEGVVCYDFVSIIRSFAEKVLLTWNRSIQHQSSRQIDTIGQNLNQLIAQQTVLLDRLNMSTENAIASPEKMHYILAHALRTDRHFMVENRQKLKYLFTITDCNREIFRAVTTSLNDPEWNFKLEVVAHTRQRTPRSRPSGGQTVEKSFKSLISSFVFFSNELDFWRRSPVLSRYGIRLYLREGSLAASYASISLPWGLDGSRNDITLKIQTWNSLCHDLLQDVPDPLRAFSPSGSFQELSKLDSYVQISFELGSWWMWLPHSRAPHNNGASLPGWIAGYIDGPEHIFECGRKICSYTSQRGE